MKPEAAPPVGSPIGSEPRFIPAFLEEAARLAQKNVCSRRGGPFGAVLVQGERLVARGANRVAARHDPTAHAEIEAIRRAARRLRSFDLSGCVLYVSCEPCPMCIGAIYWARIAQVFFGAPAAAAASAGFSDVRIAQELRLPPEARTIRLARVESAACEKALELWRLSPEKVPY